MADGVLPLFGVVPVEGESFRNELVDAPQSQLAVSGVGDGHGDECDVTVRRLPSLERSLSPPTSGLFFRLGRRIGSRRGVVCRRILLHFHHRHRHG